MTDEKSVADAAPAVNPQPYDEPRLWVDMTAPAACVVRVAHGDYPAPWVQVVITADVKLNLAPDDALRLASDLRDAVADIRAQAALDEAAANPLATPEVDEAMIATLQPEVPA